MNFFEISVYFLWFAIILLICINYFLAKLIVNFLKNLRITKADLHNEELKIGEKVPFFRETDQLGRTVKLIENKEKYILLLFASKTCGMCKDVLSGLHTLSLNEMKVIVVSENDDLIEYHHNNINFIKSRQIYENFNVKTVPTSMILNREQYLLYEFQPISYDGLKIHIDNFFQTKQVI